MQRRKFLKGLASILGFTTIAGLYSWQLEPFWLEFVKVKMPIGNIPRKLVGKTLMQISDIHVGPKVDFNYLVDSLTRAKAYQPDFVVYTGDFIHYEDEGTLVNLRKCLNYAPKGKLGTLAILGNHDYGEEWVDDKIADTITAILEEKGIIVLRNNCKRINGLNFIGIDDCWGTNFNPKKALKNYNPNEATIVLCHNPDVCDLDVWNGYDSWILSGHTHGGQCKIPFIKAPILPVENKAYDKGLKRLSGGRTLYINRALGHLYQVRFNVRPEITIFKLS